MLRDKMLDTLEKLGQEAQNLTEERFHLTQRIGNIDIRLTQIVGAITEIKALLEATATDPEGPAESSPPPPESQEA